MQNSSELFASSENRVAVPLARVVATREFSAPEQAILFRRVRRMARRFDNYIDGRMVPSGGASIEVTNPANHDVLALVEYTETHVVYMQTT
jgi:hypothetical protein